ncbi:uncharacterized protein LOC143230726 [Tachypleus tridentatus]|uniref:uncharacterized protein LOC143230726 n=1 Tax=Tachypleus tridentatus TaxID=6853 RepID=UPI003FD49651
MRSFIDAIANVIEIKKSAISLMPYLLNSSRFTGSHVCELISKVFEAICNEYLKIRNKLDYIICNNTSNFKKEFTMCYLIIINDDPGSTSADDLNGTLREDQQDVDKALDQELLKAMPAMLYTHPATNGVR